MRQISEAVPSKLNDKPVSWFAYVAKWTKRRYRIAEKPYDKRYDQECGPRPAIFVPVRGSARREYNPMECSPAILSDVQRFKDEPLQFVNRWGKLGVGTTRDDQAGYDEVEETHRRLSFVAGWLDKYKNKTASLETLKHHLNAHLAWIHPEIEIVDGKLRPVFRPYRLYDAIILRLWEMVALGGTKLKYCAGCRGLFLQERANQKYCHRGCNNRAHSRTVRKERTRSKQRYSQKTTQVQHLRNTPIAKRKHSSG
jgi:hypothetical protein